MKFIYVDAKAGTGHLMVLPPEHRRAKYRPISFHRYRQDVSVNVAKGLFLPHLRGTWLPSVNKQRGWGFAVNWLGIRVRVDLLG